MRFLLDAAVKDLRWRRRDPAAIAIWVGIPLFIGSLFGLLFASGGGPAPQAHVLLVDEDDSFVSRFLASAAAGGGTGGESPIRLERVAGRAEGQARIDAGEATALLVIPAGFGEAVLREEPAKLTLVTNPAQRILPLVVREMLEILVEAAFYAQRLAGEPLRKIAEGPSDNDFPSNAEIAAISTGINDALRRIRTVVFPPVITVDFPAADLAQETSRSDGELFFPGLLIMSLVFVAQGMTEDVWTEKEGGTLRRALTTPNAPALLLGGRLLACAAIVATVAAAGLALGVFVYGFPVRSVPLALAWLIYTGCALLTFFTVAQMLGGSRRGGTLITLLILFPLVMIGGSFFPFAMMPGWMVSAGRLTPNGQAVVQLESILRGTFDPYGFAVAAFAMGIPATALFLLAARWLPRFAVR